MTEKVYLQSMSFFFALEAVLNPKGNNLISYKHKSCVVYRYECCCSNSYIAQTLRHLETRIRLVPKCVLEHVKHQRKKKSNATSNMIKRSSISEPLMKNPVYRNSYSKMRFKILRSCTNIWDLIKIEALYIHLNKSK